MTHQILKITDDDDGARLDRWLKKHRPDLPYVLVQKLLRKGQVRVNGKRAGADQRLVAGDQVRMPLGGGENAGGPGGAQQKDSAWLRQFLIHEDNDILVFNKPSGLAVQGGSGLKLHLEMLMEGFARRGVPPRLVHRLDRETSGVLVLARSARAARRLGEQFAGKDIQKEYLAVVSAAPVSEKGTIDAPLMKTDEGTDIEKMRVDPRGQEATTDYRVLGHGDHGTALVAFYPRTGRTHQIRVHAAHIGCPLLGDKKYGGDTQILKKVKGPMRVHLHAAAITFTHPGSGERVTFKADVPADMVKTFQGLGLDEFKR